MTDSVTEPLFIQTPLISSARLSKIAGCKILLKLENLQPSGSFKSRGLGNFLKRAIERLGPEREPHFYCSSEGNAGLAAASAARILGRKATICVTHDTPRYILERLRTDGAEVRRNGYFWSDADDLCQQLVKEDPDGDVIDGNASMMDEIVEQMNGAVPDGIVCCVGGGGLIGGIFKGLKMVKQATWKNVPVVAVETTGAGSFHASHVAGQLVGIPEITSIAKSLGAKKISQITFDLAQQHSGPVKSVLVSDAQAANATWRFANDQRIMVEVAGGATLSLVYENLLNEIVPNLTENSTVVLIICGGSSVSVESLMVLKEKYGQS